MLTNAANAFPRVTSYSSARNSTDRVSGSSERETRSCLLIRTAGLGGPVCYKEMKIFFVILIFLSRADASDFQVKYLINNVPTEANGMLLTEAEV